MAEPSGHCETCKWCLSWTQMEQRPRAGAVPNLAGQYAQADHEPLNVLYFQCRRYPPQVFGEATVQPAGFWRQSFPGVQATDWCGEYAVRGSG